MTHTDGAPAAQPSFQEFSTGDARMSRGSRVGLARGCAYPALTALREFNDHAAMWMIYLVARVRLELTTSAL